ncbi:hypothetical protein [Aquisphaera insulae]|uniref:hypothetical protein n=1 Tax=Aquisphaera insulae TaxID=2712864 RepID=UPI0013EC61CD|nr:hypothetical protein [Aquisphaera insulae]
MTHSPLATPRDPDLAQLYVQASRVRQAIEATPSTERAGNLVSDPRECCDHGMKLLTLHLVSLGFSGLVRARGVRPKSGRRHVWLEWDSVILDITADQFGKIYRPVIVTRRSRWHEAWRPEREELSGKSLTRWREADTEAYRNYRLILTRLPGSGPEHGG